MVIEVVVDDGDSVTTEVLVDSESGSVDGGSTMMIGVVVDGGSDMIELVVEDKSDGTIGGSDTVIEAVVYGGSEETLDDVEVSESLAGGGSSAMFIERDVRVVGDPDTGGVGSVTLGGVIEGGEGRETDESEFIGAENGTSGVEEGSPSIDVDGRDSSVLVVERVSCQIMVSVNILEANETERCRWAIVCGPETYHGLGCRQSIWGR